MGIIKGSQYLSIILLFVLIGVGSCIRPPEFPLEPRIDLVGLEFIDVNDGSSRDTLALTLHFTDGDGDLGLDPTLHGDNTPYSSKIYPTKSDGQLIKIGDPEASDFPYEFPYTCLNWETRLIGFDDNMVAIYDTILFKINDNHYNITIDWFVKKDGGSSWSEFDWRLFREPVCGETFDGRFPTLYDKDNPDFPLEGTMRYTMPSDGFLPIFRADSIYLEVEIKDLALNRSNKLTTPSFTLQSIKKEE